MNGLLKGQIDANTYINASGNAAAETAANAELTTLTRQGPEAERRSRRRSPRSRFTDDPIASSLAADAQHAVAVGLLTPVKQPVRASTTSARSTHC